MGRLQPVKKFKGNGCGPYWMPRRLKRILFDWFFLADCSVHDCCYTRGGDRVDRMRCDYDFWKAMRQDTLRYKGIKRGVRWVQAGCFYCMVRCFGWSSFKFRKDED
jgi:hypothetical protein